MHPAVASFYARGGEEGRLDRKNRLEFERTKAIVEPRLPDRGRIVDVGGGPGMYARWLADLGFRVEMVDVVPLHVEQALATSGTGAPFGVALGDARSLPFADGAADVVLLMGPLYHLVDRADRDLALAEAWRVLRPGGLLVAAAIGRFAWLLDATARDLIRAPEVMSGVVASVATGMSTQNPGPHSFFAYFHRPEEFYAEVAAAGFLDLELLAVESFGHLLADAYDRLADPPSASALLELIARYEQEPALIGVSSHMMAVGRRP